MCHYAHKDSLFNLVYVGPIYLEFRPFKLFGQFQTKLLMHARSDISTMLSNVGIHHTHGHLTHNHLRNGYMPSIKTTLKARVFTFLKVAHLFPNSSKVWKYLVNTKCFIITTLIFLISALEFSRPTLIL